MNREFKPSKPSEIEHITRFWFGINVDFMGVTFEEREIWCQNHIKDSWTILLVPGSGWKLYFLNEEDFVQYKLVWMY